jgi:tetratricopeptide (TPR) repeat protein
MGHADRAIQTGLRALTLDPQNWRTHLRLGEAYHAAGDYPKAIASFRNGLVLFPQSRFLNMMLIKSMIASDQFEEARKRIESPSTALEEYPRHYLLTLAYKGLGREADARRELSKVMTLDPDMVELAALYAQLGDREAAFDSLMKAEKAQDSGLQAIRAERTLDPLRSDPRFKALEARLNLPP